MDKEMYRIWWKLVHNRAGEYFDNAMYAYHWSKNADGSFTNVTPDMVVGMTTRPTADVWRDVTAHSSSKSNSMTTTSRCAG